jgi:NAD(P)-dependent dehydrogenase (short-subunit alcohol dehydrogenase family)
MNVEGRVVLITGSSQGIGLAVAQQLAAAGAHVVLSARRAERLQAEARAIRAQGRHASWVQLDVTSDSSVHAAVEQVLAEHGRIDVLVNNAGNGGDLAFLLEDSSLHLREMFDTHMFGTERTTRAVLPGMLERGSGRIVNVVSTVAYVPMPGATAYCAAKAAVVAFTNALRGELRHTPIELVLFSPPHTQTEAGDAWPLDLPKQFSVEYAAEALVATLRKDHREKLAGGNNMLLWLQRISPSWAASIMRDLGLKATKQAHAARSASDCLTGVQ